MPPNISTEDYQKLLQKITLLETEIFQLKQSRGLVKTPDWNSLGAKPKDKNKRLTDRTRSPAANDSTEWPALPLRQSDKRLTGRTRSPATYWTKAKGKGRKENNDRLTGRTRSSAVNDLTERPALPVQQRASPPIQQTQPLQWSTVKKGAKTTDPPPKTPPVQLTNRFTPLAQDPRHLSDDRDSVSPSWLTMQLKEPHTQPRVRAMKMPEIETLIVCDEALKDIKGIRHSKILCFPKVNVPKINDRILDLVAAHPTVKNLILHIGTCDIEERKSEVLKQHFTALFSTLKTLSSDVSVSISGPIPPIQGGAEYFSRLCQLSQWLSTACCNESMKFIDNFGFFWDRKHLFSGGNKLNKRGLRLFTENVKYSLKARARDVPALPTPETKTNDNDAMLSTETAKDAEKLTTTAAKESIHVALPIVEANESTLKGQQPINAADLGLPHVETPQAANESAATSITHESTLNGEPANEEASSPLREEASITEGSLPHVTSTIENSPSHVERGQAINEESTTVEPASIVEPAPHMQEEQAISVSSNDEAISVSSNDEEPEDLEGASSSEDSFSPSPISPMEWASSSEGSFSLSQMPLLDFTPDMNALVSTGIKMTPRAKRQASQPPPLLTTGTQKSVTWEIPPPPAPRRGRVPPPVPPRLHRKNITQLASFETTFDN